MLFCIEFSSYQLLCYSVWIFEYIANIVNDYCMFSLNGNDGNNVGIVCGVDLAALVRYNVLFSVYVVLSLGTLLLKVNKAESKTGVKPKQFIIFWTDPLF